MLAGTGARRKHFRVRETTHVGAQARQRAGGAPPWGPQWCSPRPPAAPPAWQVRRGGARERSRAGWRRLGRAYHLPPALRLQVAAVAVAAAPCRPSGADSPPAQLAQQYRPTPAVQPPQQYAPAVLHRGHVEPREQEEQRQRRVGGSRGRHSEEGGGGGDVDRRAAGSGGRRLGGKRHYVRQGEGVGEQASSRRTRCLQEIQAVGVGEGIRKDGRSLARRSAIGGRRPPPPPPFRRGTLTKSSICCGWDAEGACARGS